MSTRKPVNNKRSDESSGLPSVGELERGLSQDIQASYRKLVGSQPQKVTCHLFGNCVGIVIEQSVTAVEKLLEDKGDGDLVRQMRRRIDDAFREEIFVLVKRRLGVGASSVLLETSLESGTTGSLAILVSLPEVRNISSLPKADSGRRTMQSSSR